MSKTKCEKNISKHEKRWMKALSEYLSIKQPGGVIQYHTFLKENYTLKRKHK